MPQEEIITTAAVSRARWAVSTIFFVNGALFASWVPHIPFVQHKFKLSEGALGLVLLSVALGAVISLILSGWLIGRFGSRLITSLATMGLSIALVGPILSPTVPLLVLCLFIFGFCIGAMDVAMNAQGVAVENRYPQSIMSSFHGLFSLGGLTGAGLGGLVLAAGLSPVSHVWGAALLLGGLGAVALRGLLPTSVDQASDAPLFAIPTGPIAGLSGLAFFTLVGEGAMADWSAVYLRNSLQASPGLAAAGFAAFSLMMAVGRLTGDRLVDYVGAVTVVRSSASLASLGLGLALFIGQPTAALIGFGCVGLGLANVVPVLFSAAGRTPGLSAGAGLAAVATSGYLGFVAGPPLIGFAAEVTNLSWALGLVVIFLGLVAIFAPVVRRKAAG
jgi:MFS family permease